MAVFYYKTAENEMCISFFINSLGTLNTLTLTKPNLVIKLHVKQSLQRL